MKGPVSRAFTQLVKEGRTGFQNKRRPKESKGRKPNEKKKKDL
jgi:hypothetical protein